MPTTGVALAVGDGLPATWLGTDGWGLLTTSVGLAAGEVLTEVLPVQAESTIRTNGASALTPG